MLKNSPVWVLPMVTSNVINIATNPAAHSTSEIVINIVVIFILIALNFPLNYLFHVCQSTAIRAVEAHLRSSLVRKLQQLSISYHTETESGRLQSEIIRDVESIQALSSQIFSNMLTISLNIFVALVGESGAGKTTILNLLIGFVRPVDGHIYLDGHDLNDINLKSYRDFVSVVPQNTILFSGSIRDNITYGMPDVTEEQLNYAIKAANLSKFVSELPDGVVLNLEHTMNLWPKKESSII